jgi:hypothetical protein
LAASDWSSGFAAPSTIIVFVARGSPGIGAVIVPVTQNSKFELAPLARHVIATLVLFNATDTWGRFGIRQDQFAVFGFVPAFSFHLAKSLHQAGL